jgi:hypothetical protein
MNPHSGINDNNKKDRIKARAAAIPMVGAIVTAALLLSGLSLIGSFQQPVTAQEQNMTAGNVTAGNATGTTTGNQTAATNQTATTGGATNATTAGGTNTTGGPMAGQGEGSGGGAAGAGGTTPSQ